MEYLLNKLSDEQLIIQIDNKMCGVGYHHQNAIVERKIETLTLGDRSFLLNAKRYFPEAITTMLCPYALKVFAEQLNVLNVDCDGITPMENVLGTTPDITIKNHHIWCCPVYVLDARF